MRPFLLSINVTYTHIHTQAHTHTHTHTHTCVFRGVRLACSQVHQLRAHTHTHTPASFVAYDLRVAKSTSCVHTHTHTPASFVAYDLRVAKSTSCVRSLLAASIACTLLTLRSSLDTGHAPPPAAPPSPVPVCRAAPASAVSVPCPAVVWGMVTAGACCCWMAVSWSTRADRLQRLPSKKAATCNYRLDESCVHT